MRIARADRLDLPGVLTDGRRQGHSARHQHARQIAHAGQGQHHGRQAFVAGGHAQHSAARGQRADQAAKQDRRVVAIRQAVEHAGGSLRATIAWIGAIAGKRDAAQSLQLARRGLHEQADLPVPRMKPQRDRRAVFGAHAPLRAQDQELRAGHFGRRPAHAGILRQAEQVAAGQIAKHFVGQRERTGRAIGRRHHAIKRRIGVEQIRGARRTSRHGLNYQGGFPKQRPQKTNGEEWPQKTQ